MLSFIISTRNPKKYSLFSGGCYYKIVIIIIKSDVQIGIKEYVCHTGISVIPLMYAFGVQGITM